MKDFGSVLFSTAEFMKTKLSFDGITFSFWDVFLWLIVAGAVVFLLWKWIGD